MDVLVKEPSQCYNKHTNSATQEGRKMKKLYDFLKYLIYGSFYLIVIKTAMDYYSYKRFPHLNQAYSAPWYTEALLYGVASLGVIVLSAILRWVLRRKMRKNEEKNDFI